MSFILPPITEPTSKPTLAIVGGGLAGIAAAETALRQGFQVALFERSQVLGGRVASLYEPISDQWIDNGQHVVLGCCSELLALNQRLGLNRFFEQQDSFSFSQTDGKCWKMSPVPFLPPKWQFIPAFLSLSFLSFKDRWATGRILQKLGKMELYDENMPSSFAQWLAAEQVSENAMEKFWAPIVFSTLSETLENVCFAAVHKVVRDALLAGKKAMSVYIPVVPLRTIYHHTVSDYLKNQGVNLHFFKRIKRLCWELQTETKTESESAESNDSYGTDNMAKTVDKPAIPRITAIEFADGSRQSFDYYVLAVPSFRFWEIMAASDLEPYTEQLGLDRFEPGAITTIHLWFNQRLLPPDCSFTALIGGSGQFLFCPRKDQTITDLTVKNEKTKKNELTSEIEKKGGIYHNVVISASHRLLSEKELTASGSRNLADRILEQLRATFPKKFRKGAVQLLHHRVTTYFDAIFSPSPNVYSDRPVQETPFSNLALAGDWTQTEWPATIEGAVRSGRLAVESLADTKNMEK